MKDTKKDNYLIASTQSKVSNNNFFFFKREITLYPPEVSSVCLPLPTSFKNKGKFVFLLPFYISILSKHKKLKKIKGKEDLKARFCKN